MAGQGLQVDLLLLLCLLAAAASGTARDYYETLNVQPAATDTQIKRAFRTLAVKYHPDKNKSAGAETAFREIAEAYKVLSNSEKRRQYDAEGHEAFLRNQADGDSGDEDHSDFPFSFADFYHMFDDDDDDDHSEEESHFHWNFDPEGEDHHENDCAGPQFSFPFNDNEEYYYYY